MLTRYKYLRSSSALEVCYISYIIPILEYANSLYDICTIENCHKLESVQITVVRLDTDAKKKNISSIFIQRAGVDDFGNKKENS